MKNGADFHSMPVLPSTVDTHGVRVAFKLKFTVYVFVCVRL